ncbi:MAG: DNA-protecting protein DprA, partial [Lachnospiraceae bacterium]|nr:DNA-protecting protein DprA [Lachnospiraceae bacterium]
WFTNIEGFGRKTRNRLLDIFESPERLYSAGDDILANINFIGEKRIKALSESKKQCQEKELEKLIKSGIYFIHKESSGYPSKLKYIPDMPHSLYLKGDVCQNNTYSAIFDMPSAAVVGSRKCSKYGYESAYRIGYELAAAGVSVVSGMARGIDSAALMGCVHAGGIPVAVLGCGVDVCYPPVNINLYTDISKKGVIMSEYPPKTAPLPGLFPERNRIISGLGDVLIVVEAGERSGTFITVDMALEQGREVYAVPGRITDGQSRGCNSLIAQGACVFMGMDDIVDCAKNAAGRHKALERITERGNYEEMKTVENCTSGTVLNEKKVYSAVGILPKHIDVIARETGLGIEEVMAIVCRLELKKLIKHTDNNYFILNW